MRVPIYKSLIIIAFLSAFGGAAQAEVPIGLWKSGPDAYGKVVYVRTKPCGRALCGRVERAKDRNGYDTPSNVVGRKVLWDMVPQPDGSYQGKIWEASGDRMLGVRMQVQGNIMQLHNCDEASCQDVTWTRLR